MRKMENLTLGQLFSNSSLCKSHLESLLEQILEATPRDTDSMGLGWSLRSCISNKLQ